MQALRIDWTFYSPLILSDFAPLHLDALLAFAKVNEAEKNEEENPYSFQNHLPFEKEGSVWKASQLLFVRESAPFLIYMVRKYEGMEMMQDFGIGYTGKTFLKSACNQGSGKYKGYTLTQQCCWMKSATAWCIGDKAEIQQYLENITALGKLTRNGFGKVKDFRITEDPSANEKWSIRILPSREKRNTSVEYVDVMSPLSPPYWDKLHQQEAIKPIFCEPEVIQQLVM